VALRTLSCFSGGYGLELGLELAFPTLFEPILYVEGEITAAGFLAGLVTEGLIPAAPIWSDVRTVCDAKVRAYLRRRADTGRAIKGAVQVITGGYPCPSFSAAGKKQGFKSKKGKLWFSLAKAVKVYKPQLCFFENVGGHLRRGFNRVRSDLRSMGYSVTAGLFTAEEVGDTQKRERLFIMACRKDSNWGRASGAHDSGRGHSEVGGSCGVLASPERRNLRHEQGRSSGPSRAGAALAGNNGTELALSKRSGRKERQGKRQGVQQQCPPAKRSGNALARLPIFPPGPDSLFSWLDVLKKEIGQAPAIGKALESKVCRLVNGLARVDVLRIYGNGVVPLQAAYAFRTLAAAAGLVMKRCRY